MDSFYIIKKYINQIFGFFWFFDILISSETVDKFIISYHWRPYHHPGLDPASQEIEEDPESSSG